MTTMWQGSETPTVGRTDDFPNKHNFTILFRLFAVTWYISFAKGCPKPLCFVRSEVLTAVEATMKMETGDSSDITLHCVNSQQTEIHILREGMPK